MRYLFFAPGLVLFPCSSGFYLSHLGKFEIGGALGGLLFLALMGTSLLQFPAALGDWACWHFRVFPEHPFLRLGWHLAACALAGYLLHGVYAFFSGGPINPG